MDTIIKNPNPDGVFPVFLVHYNSPTLKNMTTTIIEATVKYPTGNKVFQGQYGDYQNLVLTPITGGEDIKIFCKPGQLPHTAVKKGESVKVLERNEGGKVKRELIADSKYVNQPLTETQGQTKPAPEDLNPEQKRAYISSLARMYGFCLEQVAIEILGATARVNAHLKNVEDGLPLFDLIEDVNGELVETQETADDKEFARNESPSLVVPEAEIMKAATTVFLTACNHFGMRK